MVTQSDVKAYLVDRATFVLSVFEFSAVGGIAGGVTGGVLSYLDKIPFVQSGPAEVGALGALFGFAVPFARRALGK